MVEKRKIIAEIVSTAIVLNALPGVPFWAAQEETEVICEVEELSEETVFQTVEYGTGKGRLKLPRRLEVMIRDMEDEDTDIQEASASNASRSNAEDNRSSEMKNASPSEAADASRSNADKGRERKGTVSVRWELEESFSEQDEYDGKVPGIYVFQAELKSDRYELETSLPVIEVQVLEDESVQYISDWEWEESEFLQDGVLSLPGVNKTHQADFETVKDMLPKEIEVSLGGGVNEEEREAITLEDWNCSEYKQDEDGNWPISGSYIFRADLPPGYELMEEVEPLTVEVVLGGAQLMGNNIAVGPFILSSPEGLDAGDYTYQQELNPCQLIINSGKEITIENPNEYSSVNDITISIASGVDANLTLKNVMIDVSGSSDVCAFDMSQTSSVTLNLEGANELRSGGGCAGLQMGSSGGTLTVKGNGSLSVYGGANGSGVGSGYNEDINSVTIHAENSLSAYGGENGAGIGSGYYVNVESIHIDGRQISGHGGNQAAGIGSGAYGTVGSIIAETDGITAYGGDNGAGIGSGNSGKLGAITIKGSQGTLEGGANGAGIGTGNEGNWGAGSIQIENAYLVVRGGEGAAGIGGGKSSNGGMIQISGGTVEVTGDPDSEIIGNGVNGSNSGVWIEGASVKADSVVEVHGANGQQYICKLEDQGGVTGVAVDEMAYNISHNHRDGDNALYLYLTQGQHDIEIEKGETVSRFTVDIAPNGVIRQRILWPSQAEELTYGEALSESALLGGEATEADYEVLNGVFQWENADYVPQAGDNQEFAIQFVADHAELQTLENNLQVNIKPAQLTITADNKTMSVGDEQPEYTAAVQGLANGESIDQITFSDSAGDYSVPGEYCITPSGGKIVGGNESLENYEAVYQPGILTILEKETPADPGGSEDGDEEEQDPGNENEEIQTPSEDGTHPWASRGDSDDGETNTIIIDPQKGRVDRDRGILTGTLNGTGGGYSHWHETTEGWRLQYADGSYASGSQTTDSSGNIIEIYRWELINRIWYAFDSRGYAADGLIYDGGYGGWFYVKADSGMKVGWQQIEGKWYYFNPRSDGKMGMMFTNRQTLDGWYVKENGEWDGQPKY